MVVLVGAVLAVALPCSVATASENLSSTLLTTALPGFVQTPLGPDNGPINSTNINTLFSSDTVSQRAQMSQELSDGNLSGYVRIWRKQPLQGDGLVLTVFQTSAGSSISALLGGYEKGAAALSTELGGSTFSVPGVVDAQGYDINVVTQNPPFREFVIAFAKGDTAYFMNLVTAKYDLTENDAITLAQRQWSMAPGSAVAPTTPPSVGEDLLFGVIAALVVAAIGAVWRRARSRRAVSDDPSFVVVTYASYKRLARDQRKVARRTLMKSRLSDEDSLNDAALAWANHQIDVYWVTLSSFVALSVTVAIVSKGQVVAVSFLALAALVGALNLRSKRTRFVEMRKNFSPRSDASAPTLSS